MVEIEGTVEEIIYKNDQNGYAVLEINSKEDSITVVGYMPYVGIGETLKIEGEWTTHPDYGEQIKVSKYEMVAPATLYGMERFLSSGLIRGIGPVMAKKIVTKFGLESLNIIETHPERLTEIPGIGDERVKMISESYEKQKGLREVMVFLQGYGISTTNAIKIYKQYGDDSINLIKQNPYRLSDEIFGIGFRTADKIASSMGVDAHSAYRISSGARYVLMQYAANGHTYVPMDLLAKETARLLDVTEDEVNDSLVLLVQNGKAMFETFEDGSHGVYYIPYYTAETNTADKIMKMTLTDVKPGDIDIKKEISKIENEMGIRLAENQKIAVEESIKNSILIITGGPGTGKTTIINFIIKLFKKFGKSVALAAPTGRAAKRMSEATGYEAKTIHRLLEYSYSDEEGRGFGKDDKDPITEDVIIIDEASMIDILLMNALLKAIPLSSRLILVGDVDQLPSVGAGNVLRDIIDSGLVKVIRLKEIFRQGKESLIVVNAHKINNGEYPTFNDKENDFFFINANSQEDILKIILDLNKRRLPDAYGFDPMSDIQVLSPMRKGLIGVVNLNNELQKCLNPPKKGLNEKPMKDFIFRVGDRVMQIKNNYKMKWVKGDEKGEGVFNGDMGVIESIDNDAQELNVYFDDDKYVKYDFSDIDELNLSYCVTVHKSQGSEFPAVIMPMSFGPPMLLTRNLLYTAVTRAKKLVVIVGQEKYLKHMVDNNLISKRYSGLLPKLRKALSFMVEN
ncbi:ATP-dependent RecD-like DNA helicase [Thermoanaerobacterium sp. RBIITD]|uniref:SF1B family DNA helicase RecD2 n=1 Tax=Thermoanaerobacterium sp. RBIITD TaxID=1550240 RepID=UPI000BB86E60|nr:ATP-dependent RecD-like DNA helicase [Thermoanaerobacterium sp. RBIITD]SNX53134.1 exodeoxyribonuclease V alpha subunit [Thermoanaerobacterium sp. RBIITD]